MAKRIIKAQDIFKEYGEHQVLKGLSLEIFEGETLVILGRSGVGKSVFLRQLIGIETPDKGTVEVRGNDLSKISESKRADVIKDMGMLFQGAALFDSLSVGENIAFYLNEHCKDLGKQEIKRRVTHALALVGLEGTEDKMPSDLSGGMRKRAGLARLIVYRPKILLYDEPTTGLDPITAQQINEMINRAKKELNATSVVVTHDIRSALMVGDRIAFQHEGRILHIAPKKEFFKIQDPHLRAFFENAIVTEINGEEKIK